MKKRFTQGKRGALLMGALTVLLCLVLGDGVLGMVSYRDDPTMKTLVVLPGILTFFAGLFLPPWLFRKTVHKRDTLLNLPLYLLVFFPLRSFFEDRVFLTQHFFLRPVFSGFLSLPGEGLLAPVMAMGLMWGTGWFMLSNLSRAEDPRGECLERARAKEPSLTEEELSERKKIQIASLAALLLFCAVFAWAAGSSYIAKNMDAIELKIHDTYALDNIMEFTFDENGEASYTISNGYAFGKRYWSVRVTFLSCAPVGDCDDISVMLYNKENGEFSPAEYAPDYQPETGDQAEFYFYYTHKGEIKDYQLHFFTADPAIKTAAFYIEGQPKNFFDYYDGYMNPGGHINPLLQPRDLREKSK